MATMPVNSGDLNGNGRFATSIDVNFKRQIDALKQNRAHSMMPGADNETPLRNNNLQHNDSIY